MLNKTYIFPTKHKTNYVTEEVHIHRAPTDKSVKLLKEFENAAIDKIVETINVKDTTINCTVQKWKLPIDHSDKYIAVFSLNGKKMMVEHIADWDKSDIDQYKALMEKVATEIARSILIPAITQAYTNRTI